MKRCGPGNTTDTLYFVFDEASGKFRHSATITSPNGDAKSRRSVSTIGGGGLASFLENFTGKDRETPKLALYRLWLGNRIDSMHSLTRATGDGPWGTLHDAYYLAEGSSRQLERLFASLKPRYGAPFPAADRQPPPLRNRSLPSATIKSLREAVKSADGGR